MNMPSAKDLSENVYLTVVTRMAMLLVGVAMPTLGTIILLWLGGQDRTTEKLSNKIDTNAIAIAAVTSRVAVLENNFGGVQKTRDAEADDIRELRKGVGDLVAQVAAVNATLTQMKEDTRGLLHPP